MLCRPAIRHSCNKLFNSDKFALKWNSGSLQYILRHYRRGVLLLYSPSIHSHLLIQIKILYMIYFAEIMQYIATVEDNLIFHTTFICNNMLVLNQYNHHIYII